MSAPEPNGPGSSEMKAKCTSGTQGTYSGVPEYQLNLEVSLQLKDELEQRGYQVVMTRTDNETVVGYKGYSERATWSVLLMQYGNHRRLHGCGHRSLRPVQQHIVRVPCC